MRRKPSLPVPMWKASSRNMYDIDRPSGAKAEYLNICNWNFAVAVHEVGVGEEVHPVIDVNIEGAQQTLILEGPSLQHLLRLDLAGVSEVVHQQRAHLPAVAHFLDHHPGDGTAVPVSGSAFEEIPLLLHAGEFGIALVDDHVDERVAHLLSRDLAQVLPLAAPPL